MVAVKEGDKENDEESRISMSQKHAKEVQRDVRRKYRKLQRTVDDNRQEIIRPGNGVLSDSLESANLLYQAVKRPQEATLDSKFLLSAAELAQIKARNIKRGKEVFNIDEYFGKLASFMGNTATQTGALDLLSVGRLATRYMMRPPTMDFMLGPLSIEKKDRSTKAREQRRRSKGLLTRPEELKEEDIPAQNNTTTKNTFQIGRLLEQHSPVDLFSFIINPRSFSQSVENLFSLSFLVKDGKAAIYEAADGLQTVIHIDDSVEFELSQEVGKGDGVPGELRQQAVMDFDMATFDEAIRLLGLKTSIIPHRKETEKVVVGNGWY